MEDTYDWTDDGFRNATRVSPAQMIRAINQQQGRGGVTVVVPNAPTGQGSGVQVVPHQPPVQATALAPISQVPPWVQPYPQGPQAFGMGWPQVPPWAMAPRCPPPFGYPWGSPYGDGSPWKALKMVGVAVDMLGQIGAAFLVPVPQAPEPSGQDSIDSENHIRYQAALAQHAKTDERIRTACKVIREALDLGHSQMTGRQ